MTTMLFALALWLLVRARRGRLGILVLSLPFAIAAAAPPDHQQVGASAAGGRYVQTCGGPRRYGNVGLHYAWTDTRGPHTSLGGSVDLAVGQDEELLIVAARPMVRADSRLIGGGLGFNGGFLVSDGGYLDPLRTNRARPPALLPAASLRLGPRDIAFAELGLLDGRPTAFPKPLLSATLGVALPRLSHEYERSAVRLGISGQGFTLAPTLALPGGWSLDLTAALGDAETWGGSVGLRRFLRW